MKNLKIIGKIATGFGIIFAVFAAFAALLEYETLFYQYGNTAPAGFIQVVILTAMLPFLMLAVLSFLVAAITRRAPKESIEETSMESEEAPTVPDESGAQITESKP
jgi:hypothetical protein